MNLGLLSVSLTEVQQFTNWQSNLSGAIFFLKFSSHFYRHWLRLAPVHQNEGVDVPFVEMVIKAMIVILTNKLTSATGTTSREIMS